MRVLQGHARLNILKHIIVNTGTFYPGGLYVISNIISKLISDIVYLILHVANSGSFPLPLSAKEEKELLERMERGDEKARAKLMNTI